MLISTFPLYSTYIQLILLWDEPREMVRILLQKWPFLFSPPKPLMEHNWPSGAFRKTIKSLYLKEIKRNFECVWSWPSRSTNIQRQNYYAGFKSKDLYNKFRDEPGTSVTFFCCHHPILSTRVVVQCCLYAIFSTLCRNQRRWHC